MAWAPWEGLEGPLSDAFHLTYHGLLQLIGADERLTGDSHYNYDGFLSTHRPPRDELDVMVNALVSSIKEPIESTFGEVKNANKAFNSGWRHARAVLFDVWRVSLHAHNYKLLLVGPRVLVNPLLTFGD